MNLGCAFPLSQIGYGIGSSTSSGLRPRTRTLFLQWAALAIPSHQSPQTDWSQVQIYKGQNGIGCLEWAVLERGMSRL